MMDITALIIVLIAITMGAFGQISFKQGMNKVNLKGMKHIFNIKNLIKVFTTGFVVLGVFLYGFGTLFWLVSMTRLDISFMYPLVSLSYLFTAIIAVVFLKEHVKMKRWTGIFLIIAGCFFMMLGA